VAVIKHFVFSMTSFNRRLPANLTEPWE